jgi:hypothetical protein
MRVGGSVERPADATRDSTARTAVSAPPVGRLLFGSTYRSTAFDLYHELDGCEGWRRRWMRIVTLVFRSDPLRQTVRNLRHAGVLVDWARLHSAGRLTVRPRWPGLARRAALAS